jgi:hypothetical protein
MPNFITRSNQHKSAPVAEDFNCGWSAIDFLSGLCLEEQVSPEPNRLEKSASAGSNRRASRRDNNEWGSERHHAIARQ